MLFRSGEIHFTAEEAINTISQKLSIAQNKDDVTALQAAKYSIFSISTKDGKTVYQHFMPEHTFLLQLQVLQVADRMQDKSYDRNAKLKAGIYGNVPWPPDCERPEELRKTPLWMQGTRPEYFKDRDPELYAFYKPLYEENQRNTAKYLHEGAIRGVRDDLLRTVKDRLKSECARGADSRCFTHYLRLIEEVIVDNKLRDEILVDITQERRLLETISKEKTSQ